MALQGLDGMSNDGGVWSPRNLPLASNNLAKKLWQHMYPSEEY
jgi:hypothetical protein